MMAPTPDMDKKMPITMPMNGRAPKPSSTNDDTNSIGYPIGTPMMAPIPLMMSMTPMMHPASPRPLIGLYQDFVFFHRKF